MTNINEQATLLSDIKEEEPIIICRNVNKWYGEFQALRNVSLEVMPQLVSPMI